MKLQTQGLILAGGVVVVVGFGGASMFDRLVFDPVWRGIFADVWWAPSMWLGWRSYVAWVDNPARRKRAGL